MGGSLAGADLGRRGRPGPGVICWPSSSWLRVSRCWMSSPSWAPGCGCWPQAAVNKNDPNDARSVAVAALRSPGRREVKAGRSRGGPEDVVQASPGPGPDPDPGRLPVARGVVRADPGVGYPRRSPHVTPLMSWNRSRRRGRWRQPAVSSPPRSLMTCAALTPSRLMPRRSSTVAVRALGHHA